MTSPTEPIPPSGELVPRRRAFLCGLAATATLGPRAPAAAMGWLAGPQPGTSTRTGSATGPASGPIPSAQGLRLHDWGSAPEFRGLQRWFNSPALTLAQLRGRVVLVDFWTHGCINCLRTLPHVKRWASTWGTQGLVVVGVHSPEFAYEREEANVRRAIVRHGVTHPVAMDNDHATWRAYQNQHWPAHYLIDRRGRIRHRQFGEGGHAAMEAAIQALLVGQAEARPAAVGPHGRADGDEAGRPGLEAAADAA